MLFRILLSALLTCVYVQFSYADHREINLKTWEFSRDNVHWYTVKIPHDWAIRGPFDKKWDLQNVAITQNGETEKTEKSGRSGALPWIGEGIYRYHLRQTDLKSRHATLCFDGAMSEPTVYVNGQKAGYWAYGYNAFRLNITPFLHEGDNLIEVHLKNIEESSRWYPGGGLYRPVTLVITDKARIDTWGTYIRTVSADSLKAVVSIDMKALEFLQGSRFVVDITNKYGYHVQKSCPVDLKGEGRIIFHVARPKLWSPETPYLYKVRVKLVADKEGKPNVVYDEQLLNYGVRIIDITKEHGFRLNGVSRKIKGVCLHHDLGPLGAAVNKAALIRQIRILKDMGCDAIRTAHNMPSSLQMEICDSMGMMVIAESFDMWVYPKCKNGYARFFKEWSDRDIMNLILNHRNHPCIIMWSIGNEIPEQWSKEGVDISKHLQDLCHSLDPSRMVTQGMDRPDEALASGFAQIMDVPGFNYRVHKYDDNIRKLPQGFLLGTETASTVSSRNVYKFPVKVTDNAVYSDGQCSSYDTEYCSWSNLPDDDFSMQDHPWIIGQFVWTGFDYLGEPTPYDEYWPSRSSYFGICDLAGIPKDRYYLYRSVWNTNSHTIHLLPHWTWTDRIGKITPVFCYTDYPTAELFVNGKSQGRISKSRDGRLTKYRLCWNNVVYEPGELKVVVYDIHSNKAGEKRIYTAGIPHALKIDVDRDVIQADGNDLAFITVSMIDKSGNEVPTSQDELNVKVSGQGSFKCICNGDATNLQSFVEPKMKLFNGKLVIAVQSSMKKGKIKVNITDAVNKKITKSVSIKTE